MDTNQRIKELRRLTRAAFKRGYLAVPFKKQLFTALRSVWIPPKYVFEKLYFDGTFRVEIEGGHPLELVHTHNHVECDLFWTGIIGEFEHTTISTWLKLAKQARVVIDIGANTGVYALSAKALNQKAEVYAFEPMPRIFSKLVRNNTLNGGGIHCEQAAASNFDGDATMYDLPNSEHTYGGTVNKNLYAEDCKVEPLIVKATRLETFIQKQGLKGVDLIKIDVESHEPAVIEGLGAELTRSRPAMLVEVWNNEVGEAVERLVSGHDYLYFATDDLEPFERQTAIRQPPRRTPFTNYLLCSKETAVFLGLTF